MTNRIAVSPLSGRIHQGRVNKAGDAFVGEKRDVTSDVLAAVIEKAEFHGGTFEIEGGGRKWTVAVTDGAAAVKTDTTRDAVLHACSEALAGCPDDKPDRSEWDSGFREGLKCAVTVVRAALHKP